VRRSVFHWWWLFVIVGLNWIISSPAFSAGPHPAKPNIVVVLCDDLGYGDVGAFNPKCRIPTPHINQLADQGMCFTDAHSSSAVCSPTRYALLTGRYNWRSRLQQGVLGGMSPRLIEPGRLTLPRFLQQQGYRTACMGKWHVGMDWTRNPGAAPFDDNIEKGVDGWKADFHQPIRNGPLSVGFDEFFGIAASLDMVPYTFVRNDRVTEVPTVNQSFPMRSDRTGGRTRNGPGAPSFSADRVLPELTREAIRFLEQQAIAARQGDPFFLYLPLNSPHTPIAPSPEWIGRSGLNAYADFVMETDHSLGQLLQALDRLQLTVSTLVVFTSDNGCSPEADFAQLRAQGHDPSAGFRGYKADLFEGGHRVPLIARWPGTVPAGTRYKSPILLNDLFATVADLLQQRLPEEAAEDSVSLWRVLRGGSDRPVREAVVHHSINGSFAIRSGRWKLLLCPDSGGWSQPRPGAGAAKGLPPVQLYDLESDPGETRNLSHERPQVVARLSKLLERTIERGRSTPGRQQTNTVPVVVRR
jgi:arylsulfatase A